MRLLALLLVAAISLPVSNADARSQGDEAGTLKGMRGAHPPATSGAPKGKPGKSPGLMEEEGIFYKDKPAGTPKSR